MRCILFPTDFSPNAAHALQFAISIAGKFSAKLVLMHAYKIPYDFSSRVAQELEIEKNNADSHLKELEAECRNHYLSENFEIETLSMPADPVSCIKKAATDLEADLIIMGTKGYSSLKERLFGGNTAETILLTKFPILAIPENATIDSISRIVYATDYDENDFENLVNVALFAKVFDAEIRILHLVQEETLKEKIMYEGFKVLVAKENLYKNIHHNLIVGSDFFDSVNQYIVNCKGSMLVMANDKKSAFEKLFSHSYTHHMVYHTHVPLLVLKPNIKI